MAKLSSFLPSIFFGEKLLLLLSPPPPNFQRDRDKRVVVVCTSFLLLNGRLPPPSTSFSKVKWELPPETGLIGGSLNRFCWCQRVAAAALWKEMDTAKSDLGERERERERGVISPVVVLTV